MTISNEQADRIAYSIMESGGATFDEDGLHTRLNGYQVGMDGFGWTAYESSRGEQPYRQWLADCVQDYATNNWDWIEGKPEHAFGAWVNEGKLYLDLVIFTPDRSMAMILGELNNQKAVWDWAAMGEIPVEPQRQPSWEVIQA
jgi:hypothetical protein